MDSKRMVQKWRHCQSYEERQRAYTLNSGITSKSKDACSFNSGDAGLGIQGTKISQKPRPATSQARRPIGRDRGDEVDGDGQPCTQERGRMCTQTLSKSKRIPVHIPYLDIRKQINTRAGAECPRPPPNTPPRMDTKTYRCGDFVYEIPIEDTFTVKLFEETYGSRDFYGSEDESCQAATINEGDYDTIGEEGSGNETVEQSQENNLSTSRSEDHHSIILKPPTPSCHRLRLSVSANKFETNMMTQLRRSQLRGAGSSVHQRVAQNHRIMNQRMHEAALQNHIPPRRAAGTKSQSDLPFVLNPRILKFLEEIRLAKEKKAAMAMGN